MNRPKGLSLSAALVVLCNVMLWAVINPEAHPHYLRSLIFWTGVIGIGFVVIWFYWQGQSWARNTVLLYSALSILNLRMMWHMASVSKLFLVTPTHVLLASRALLGASLLFWLNTRSVRQFFKSNSEIPRHASPRRNS